MIKKRKFEINLISAIYYVAAFLFLLLGIVLIILGVSNLGFDNHPYFIKIELMTLDYLNTLFTFIFIIDFILVSAFKLIFPGSFFYLLIIKGFIILIFSILVFTIAKNLEKNKKWARITAIIFAFIGIIFALAFLLIKIRGSIKDIIINLIIAFYLLFNKKLKRY